MIEAKIFLLIFVWPVGQVEDRALWTSDAFLTFASCEEGAGELIAKLALEYGSDSRIEHHCVHATDRIDQ